MGGRTATDNSCHLTTSTGLYSGSFIGAPNWIRERRSHPERRTCRSGVYVHVDMALVPQSPLLFRVSLAYTDALPIRREINTVSLITQSNNPLICPPRPVPPAVATNRNCQSGGATRRCRWRAYKEKNSMTPINIILPSLATAANVTSNNSPRRRCVCIGISYAVSFFTLKSN